MSENNEVTREELEDFVDAQVNYVHSPDADAWFFDVCKAIDGLLERYIIIRKPEPLPSEPGTFWLDEMGDVWQVDRGGEMVCLFAPRSDPKDYVSFRRLVVGA